MSDDLDKTPEDSSPDLTKDRSFFDKSKFVRYCSLVLLGLVVFVVLHFREVNVETLELNTLAPRYVVSQVYFDFPDEEATLILKQEAVRDIGKIYQISQSEIRAKRIEFENFLLYNQAWYEQAEAGTFDQLYQATDLMEKILIQMRLTDVRTLDKLKQESGEDNDYFVYTSSGISENVVLPPYIWDSIQKEYFSPQTFSPLVTDLIFGFFKPTHWILEEDIPEQRQLRKKIQGDVPEKMTSIKAGYRLISQGDKVTARHLAMFQAMKQALGASRNLWHPLTLLGSLLLTILLMCLFQVYFRMSRPQLLHSNRKFCLLVTVMILTLVLAKFTEIILVNSHTNLIELVRYPLFVPLAAILICSLINPSIAAFVSGFLSIILTISLSFPWEGFLLLNIFASFIAIIGIHKQHKRKEIFIVCLKAFAGCCLMLIALHLYSNSFFQFSTLTDMIGAAFFMIMIGVTVVGLLPLLESAFGVVTDVSLMELMDPNNELLRRLTLEAPGTYQHSVVVGNLAEAAALSIGANGLFCRAATLYHDVGKIVTSQYFTENQMGEVNIHQLLTPQESAQIIMAHVPEGVILAKEAGMPEAIIDIIREHHGTTLVYYFYHKQLEKMGGDRSKVDEREFRYGGPKPRSKESGIIMIADTFEAASRSLDRMNEELLTQLIERLVQEKIDDGQFDECLLTFKDLSMVKKALVKTLLAATHSRIKYPKKERMG